MDERLNLDGMDEAAENFKKGIVGDPINLDKYVCSEVKKGEDMKTVAIEDLIIGTILTFCENAAELGCPMNKDVDMWFRELNYEEQTKVAEKIMEIEDRNIEMTNEEEVEMSKDKIITLHEIELELSVDVINGLCEFALEEIKNDKTALVNYAANKILAKIVETDGECLKDLKE